MNTAKEHWEQHYGERDRVWSGRVNLRLVEVVSTLEPGRALDLGCGEGADACWLAERGWTVVAVDISDTALQRAAAEADTRGLGDRIDFARCWKIRSSRFSLCSQAKHIRRITKVRN